MGVRIGTRGSGRGDGAAEFEDFVRSRSVGLLRTAYLLTGSRADAEDLLQEVLVSVARRWEHIDEGRTDAYARTALHRAAIDGWRRRSVRPVVVGAPTSDPTAEGDAMGASVDRLVLRDALARLTARQRAVLVLRFYEQHTEVEAAAVLGCSVSTVKSQTRRALQRLRELAPELTETFRPDAQHEEATS